MLNNIFKLAENQEPRYERKFFIPETNFHHLKSLIRLHPACFKEIFWQRRVNNVYLDSFDLKNYQDNLMGAKERVKPRVRWYGNDFYNAVNPFLEIKLKDNTCGKKLSYPLPNFAIDKNLDKQIQTLINKADLPEIIKLYLSRLKISSFNNYDRRYYLSADKKFRLTVDFNLSSCWPIGKLLAHDRGDYILELKYNYRDDENSRRISAQFPYRITKYSKYAASIAKTTHSVFL